MSSKTIDNMEIKNNQNEIKPIIMNWFDSYLEFNMYNTKPLQLMDLGKRYGVSLLETPNYDVFIKEINKKKKEKKKSSNIKIKCLECEKRNRSQNAINSHVKTECVLINGRIKYKNYPDWIKKIINTDSELYEDLKLKSKSSGIRFNKHNTIDDFLQNYYENERMLVHISKW